MINGCQRTAHFWESSNSKKKVKVFTSSPYITESFYVKIIKISCAMQFMALSVFFLNIVFVTEVWFSKRQVTDIILYEIQ